MSKPLMTPKTVLDLVKDFESGLLAVPEIQRDVVWDSSQVKGLLDSIVRGYPCGSIILWEPRERDKALVKAMIRPERLEHHENKIPRYFLLDGQQRISSVASMVLDRIKLKDILFELEEDMPYIYVNLKNISKDIEATTEKTAYKFPWVLVNQILDNTITSNPQYLSLPATTKHKISEFSSKITTYTFPTQIISDVTYEEVGEIFSRINSQGTQLTAAEIYLAKIVPHWKGITKEFREFRKQLHNDYSFDVDLTFLMKIITTIECDIPQIKKLADRLTGRIISATQLNKTWDNVKKSSKNVIEILREDLSLDKSKYILSKNALVPIVYYLNKLKNKNSARRKKISKFFLLSQLSEHYGGAADSTLRKDIRTIFDETNPHQGLSNLLRSVELDTRREYRGLRITPNHIGGVPSKNILLLFMYIAMRKRGATDFGIDTPNSLFDIPGNNLTLHHIFPVNYMMEQKFSKKYQNQHRISPYEYREIVNDISNLTFLSQDKNSSIGDPPPAEYLPNETTKQMRKAHFIPENRTLWSRDNFDKFVQERRKLLSEGMNSIMKFIH